MTKNKRTILIIGIAVALMAPAVAVASHQFTDVPDSNVFHDDIAWLADAAITTGCNPPSNTEFCPSNNVTRQQMAAFMRRFAQYLGAEDGTPAQADNATTADSAATAATAGDADTLDGMDSSDFAISGDVYTKAQVDAAIVARAPITQSTASTNAVAATPPGAVGLTVTIDAPVAGTILINASASILNADLGRYECRLTKGVGILENDSSDDLDDTDRRVEPSVAGFDTHCATNGATTVPAGTHVINFVLQTPAAAIDSFDDATLDAMFVPGGVFAPSHSTLESATAEDS